MSALLASLVVLAVDAAEEGRKIIIAMTLVGLTFLAVVVVGDLLKARSHRRARRQLGR